MVAFLVRTSDTPQIDLLKFPWAIPLEEWPDELAVRLPRGRHRHVVRFVEYEGRYYSLKELPPDLAIREYDVLSHLNEEEFPAVELVGVARGRTDLEGNPLESVLITRHLSYAMPYLHLFAGNTTSGIHMKLVDALAILLVRLHLAGIFWGDCSLGNALFRRDAGELVAYLVDTETSAMYDELSDGQRYHDIEIATENIVGGLFELEAKGRLPESVDPLEVVEQLRERYDSLWAELTEVSLLGTDDFYKVQERLRRLNELGFDTTEMEIETKEGTGRISFRPAVVEEGHHRRELAKLTGIHAEENQARRLLSAMRSYSVWLRNEEDEDYPEVVAAYRWLTERYEPTIAAVPIELRTKLTDAELYHQILEHNWFLSEAAGRDIGLDAATDDYVANVLTVLPDEESMIDNAAVAEEDTAAAGGLDLSVLDLAQPDEVPGLAALSPVATVAVPGGPTIDDDLLDADVSVTDEPAETPDLPDDQGSPEGQ